MFNDRRQSRDREVIADIARMTSGKVLYVDPYSTPLFSDSEAEYVVSSDMFSLAKAEDYCFVENRRLATFENNIDGIVLYHWNRRYPADLYFDILPERLGFRLMETEEFVGYSHEKITKEIFER